MVWEPDYSGEADKTEFRSTLSTETVSSLIGYHFNKRCKCELSLFEESLLAKGKSCTNERNKGYKHYYFKNICIFCPKNLIDVMTQCG